MGHLDPKESIVRMKLTVTGMGHPDPKESIL